MTRSSVLIGTSLREPHTSVTALCTCVCIYACLLVCLDWPLTVNFKWAHSNISRWWNVHADVYFNELSKSQTAVSLWKSKSEGDLSWMYWYHARWLCELWCESDDCVTRQAMSDPGQWPSDSWMYAGFGSLAGWIASCLGAFQMQFATPQARPRMIQHLSS